MRHKLIQIAAFALAVTSPAALFATGRTETASPDRPYEGVELRLAMDYAEHVPFVEGVIPDFERDTGIKVTVELIPYVNYRDKVVLDLASETGNYHLLQTGANWFDEFVGEANYLEPLEPYFEDPRFADPQIDGILPNLWSVYSGQSGGSAHGFPFIPDAMVFAYNTDHFAQVGLSEPPKTWDEVLDYGRRLTRDTDGDGTVDRYGFALMAGGRVQTAVMYTALLFGYGGREYDAQGNPMFDTEAGVKAMEMFVKLLEIAPPAALETDYSESAQQMAQGLTSMVITWPGAVLAPLEDPDKSSVVGDIAYAAPPNEATIIGGFSIAMSRFITDREKEAAYMFLSYFTGPEVDKQKALAGLTPIRIATYEDREVLEAYPYFGQYRHVLGVGIPFSPRPGSTDAWKHMQEYSTRAFLGELSPADAVRQMNDAIVEMLASM